MWFLPSIQILLIIYLTEGTPPLPFIVSIQTRTSNDYSHLCVGGIIHKRFVLTAAHCFQKINDINQVSVTGGNKYLTFEKNSLRHGALRILMHFKYRPLFGFDIAIIEVTPEFDFSDKRFGKLHYENVIVKDQAYLCGWGGHHKNLELVGFKTISLDRCRKSGFRHVTNSEICAFSPEGRGACEGDSGGPLVSADLKQVIGLLSYGKTPCKPKRIFTFTSIKSLEPWIKDQISKLLRGEYKKMGFVQA